ncbi:MAG: nucleoside triphosphate pyrophosphohydrolase [Candidatus Scalindua sp. AMX11]|nr:MAG: nucleoside triphosphate pyrophosphohydrolase [Candidatus Scalindua sp.]NOG83350.1 nucleoside triphosphate pyrophosphohydrolase [Planctomycetota bacterium]RZV76804.1 MAG: nucleoside triphosphate pyrophosphohydrolase [Candidatus Scalindua sp. SCAELEC01]TDE63957.1 MAG: nucleoside triphosphate pyrophosphohydrolase [Candidatus Scalindua sp. AMX11]
MKRLRSEGGCPWDKEQTHDTLKSCLIEEVYEVVDAVDSGDPENLQEELADLFFLIIFYCQISDDNGAFDLNNVMEVCFEKMTRRHPHVFGGQPVENSLDALSQWNDIKKKEVEEKGGGAVGTPSVIGNIPKHLPALQKAQKIQKKVARVGFDWEMIEDVVAKVQEELDEVKEAISRKNEKHIAEEIGDLLFATVNLSRFLKMDSEGLLRESIAKFIDRFVKVEKELNAAGKKIEECTLAEMDTLWKQVKKEEVSRRK